MPTACDITRMHMQVLWNRSTMLVGINLRVLQARKTCKSIDHIRGTIFGFSHPVSYDYHFSTLAFHDRILVPGLGCWGGKNMVSGTNRPSSRAETSGCSDHPNRERHRLLLLHHNLLTQDQATRTGSCSSLGAGPRFACTTQKCSGASCRLFRGRQRASLYRSAGACSTHLLALEFPEVLLHRRLHITIGVHVFGRRFSGLRLLR